MTADLQRRLARLEAVRGGPDELVEVELSPEGGALLEEALQGLGPVPELGRIAGPPVTLSPAAQRHLENVVKALRVGGSP